jgi:hypothetical protein
VGGGKGDTGDSVLEMDVGVGTGGYVDEVTGEDVLAGDIENEIDADFDSGASQKLVMGIFKEESHNKRLGPWSLDTRSETSPSTSSESWGS